MYVSFHNTVIGIVILFLYMLTLLIAYFNNQRKDLIEQFLYNENDHHPPIQYISNIEDDMKSPYTTVLTDLLDTNGQLKNTLSNLTDVNASIRDQLVTSNLRVSTMSNELTLLTDNKSNLDTTVTNFKEIDNILSHSVQSQVDALSDLEYTIVGEMCSSMGCVNQGLSQKESLTREKLTEILQGHINVIPHLSRSYILAVKLWIAHKKYVTILSTDNDDIKRALSTYNETLDRLKEAEESMFVVKELYEMYKRNVYHTPPSDNATITLSNVDDEIGSSTQIRFDSNGYRYNGKIEFPEYDKLFQTCTSSNVQDVTTTVWSIDSVECSASNYSLIENIRECPKLPQNDECLIAQPSIVKSGLEYIYRSELSRDYINSSTSSISSINQVDTINHVDTNIKKMFLHKVFNH